MKYFLAIALIVSAAYAAPVDDLSMPTSCEDVLAQPICQELRGIAQQIEVKFDEVEAQIKDAISQGKQTAEEIRDAVIQYLKQKIAGKTCEDFLSAKQCEYVKQAAKFLGCTVEKVDEAVREAVIEGAKTIKDIYNKVVAYIKDNFGKKRSTDFTFSDADLELLDDLEFEDVETFEKRNFFLDTLKKYVKKVGDLLGKVLDSDIDKVLQQLMETRKDEIESVVGKGPYAMMKLALEIYRMIKASG